MRLSVVIPCHNEEEMFPLFMQAMKEIEPSIPVEWEYIFVDDGSIDQTLALIKQQALTNQAIQYISFSRNFGKESALYAGLKKATGDYVAVMDVDLQDPPELLIDMYQTLQKKELDCVGCRRVTRKGEPLLRSFFAKVFYKLMNKIGEVEMVDGARDYRLMTRQMTDSILTLGEHNRFSKGLFAWVGYRTEYIEYENIERIAGKTSWNFLQLLSYSVDGIINFSDIPLRIASFFGVISCVVAVGSLFFIVIRTLLFGDPVSGWPSTISIILLLGGLQLLCLGIIGKYLGKIFLETKKRPLYVVKEES